MSNLRILTKFLLVCGLLLILYGFAARFFDIFFFWESRSIGWILVLLGLVSLFAGLIKANRGKNKSVAFEKIGLILVVATLVVQIGFFGFISFTDAYSVAGEHFQSAPEFTSELGDIQGFSIHPIGSFSVRYNAEGESGKAVIHVTIKGAEKYRDVTAYLSKRPDRTSWHLEALK